MKKSIFIGAMLIFTACGSRQTTYQVEPLRVGVIEVEKVSDRYQKSYVGTIEEERSAALSFPLGGTILSMNVQEGQMVNKGDVVATLDATSARQAFEAAKATLSQAKDAYARLKKLHDEESLPEIKWVEVQTKLRQAESSFTISEKNLKDCTMRSPFTGVVGHRKAEVGETLLPGMPVLTVLQINQVKVRFSVPETEIASISKESRIRLTVAALQHQQFEAVHPEKGVWANPAAHTYDVRATIPNQEQQLLPGMVCRVEVSPREAKADHYVLPLSAVREGGDGVRYVWKVNPQTKIVERQQVLVGGLVDNGLLIEEGIQDGDLIVGEGVQKIGQGSKVVW